MITILKPLDKDTSNSILCGSCEPPIATQISVE